MALHSSLLRTLVLIVAASGSYVAQASNTPATPVRRIVVKLPDNVESNFVSIRYLLRGARTATYSFVRQQPNLREYSIDAVVGGSPAQQARVVVYAPGCQFETYDLTLTEDSDRELRFTCKLLPTKVVRGFIPVAEMPSTFISKTFEIAGELEADWICDFFMRQQVGSQVIINGSCLVPSIPLGIVGKVLPAQGGEFEIAIPDFTADPVFNLPSAPGVARHFGFIELALQDSKVKRIVATIQEKDFPDRQRGGLRIQSVYPNPVLFTRVR
jgi:hypothetical protein